MKKKLKKETGLRRIFGLLLLLLLALGFSAMTFSANPLDSRIAEIRRTAAQVVDSVRSRDLDRVSAAFADLDALVNEYHSLLTDSPLALTTRLPGYGEDVETVVQYMELWQEAYPKLIIPVLDKAKEVGVPNMDVLSTDPATFSYQMREYAGLVETLYPDLLTVAERFNEIPEFQTAEIADRVGPYQALLKELCGLVLEFRDLPDDVIRPAADLLESYPPASLRGEDGIHVEPVLRYLDFYSRLHPYVLQMSDALERVDLSLIGKERHEKLVGAVETAKSMLERIDKYVPVAETLLADGQDQIFLVVAQNSAELRAAGGFPGVVVVATVKNGCASLGDFYSSWELFPGDYVGGLLERSERQLFGSWFIAGPKDATINPHFPMVADAWADVYNYWRGVSVAGVVSVTPHVVRELVEICGPITLSNGVELTGENFMQYLQHDIYYQYLARDTADLSTVVDGLASDDTVNALFEETAKTVMEKIFDKLNGHLTLDDIEKLMDMVDNSFANRTALLWMADEEAEQQIKELGWSGALNWDPQKPEIGVYFSVQDANKVGYFVDIQAECDESGAVRNENGSVTWPVKVVLRNMLTQEDLDAGEGNWYKLLGSYNGNIVSLVHLFAPAGGRIDNIAYSISEQGLEGYNAYFSGFNEGNYKDLQVYYNNDFWLCPGEVLEFTYTVTTAPGVSAKPTFSMTPICSLNY